MIITKVVDGNLVNGTVFMDGVNDSRDPSFSTEWHEMVHNHEGEELRENSWHWPVRQ